MLKSDRGSEPREVIFYSLINNLRKKKHNNEYFGIKGSNIALTAKREFNLEVSTNYVTAELEYLGLSIKRSQGVPTIFPDDESLKKGAEKLKVSTNFMAEVFSKEEEFEAN